MRKALGGLILAILALGPGCSRPDVHFPQFEKDSLLTWGISHFCDELFDQNVSALPVGAQDITTDCPTGGTVHITGSLDSTDGKQFDLEYDFTGCDFTYSEFGASVSLTLTGRLNHKRSLDVVDIGVEEYNCDELRMSGDLSSGGDSASVDATCPFYSKLVRSYVSFARVGDVCDRPVTSTYWHSSCSIP